MSGFWRKARKRCRESVVDCSEANMLPVPARVKSVLRIEGRRPSLPSIFLNTCILLRCREAGTFPCPISFSLQRHPQRKIRHRTGRVLVTATAPANPAYCRHRQRLRPGRAVPHVNGYDGDGVDEDGVMTLEVGCGCNAVDHTELTAKYPYHVGFFFHLSKRSTKPPLCFPETLNHL